MCVRMEVWIGIANGGGMGVRSGREVKVAVASL